jgi:hypothetical protein
MIRLRFQILRKMWQSKVNYFQRFALTDKHIAPSRGKLKGVTIWWQAWVASIKTESLAGWTLNEKEKLFRRKCFYLLTARA